MDGDSDGDAYTDIDMDNSGKPFLTQSFGGAKRPPIPTPTPQSSRTPPTKRVAPRPPVRKSYSMNEKNGPLPPIPQQASNAQGQVSQLAARFRSKTMSDGAAPPPRPPKPPPALDWDDLVAKPKKRNKTPISDFIIDAEELNPSAFVKKHQEQFPLKVRVCKGFYGHSERTSVSEGDTFNVHFVKHTKVVHMLDGGGATYKIPLNSALEFGIMFDPNEKRDEALNGFVFEKVSDLMAAKTMPHAVRTGAGWRGSGASASIENNELLVIKGVKRRLNTKTLKVYSPLAGKKKELPEQCVGKFTTRPYDVRFFLSEITEYLPNAIPCQAMLFVHSETASELPSHLVTAVITLTETSTETSLIATNTEVDDFTDAPMIDIPLDLDIEFQVLHYKRQEDTEQLYSDTRTLLENFNPGKVTKYTNDSSNVYSISVVREGNAFSGVDIVKPSTIYYNVHELAQMSKTPAKSSTSSPSKSVSEAIYEMEPTSDSVFTDGADPKLDQRLKTIENTLHQLSTADTNPTQISRQITSARADMKRLESRTVKAIDDTAELRKQVSELNSTVKELQGLVSGLSGQLKQLQEGRTVSVPPSGSGYMAIPGEGKTAPVTPTPSGYMPMSSGGCLERIAEQTSDEGVYHVIPPSGQTTSSVERQSPASSTLTSPMQSQASIPDSVCEENRLFLSSLDYMQVLRLLELMGLKAYQESFMTERVNGEMLLECDDDVLSNELKITSKLRRVRLMKLISGRHSAEQILRGEDPYVYAAAR